MTAALSALRRLVVFTALVIGLAVGFSVLVSAGTTTPAHAETSVTTALVERPAVHKTATSSDTPRQGGARARGPQGPHAPQAPNTPTTVQLNFPGANGKPSQSLVIILAITVLAIAPALLMLLTSFTKVVVVLSLTRNALGLQSVPPNQVLAGLALFLSLFIMGPTLSKVYADGIQPYLHGEKSQSQAWDDGSRPLKSWMLDHTRQSDLSVFVAASHQEKPKTREDVALPTLVPAFVLSELKSAFIIGFVIFLPFLLIDLVVSSSLMSLGMMMVPPVMVSLPFKLLLFVLVDGWVLVAQALVRSYA